MSKAIDREMFTYFMQLDEAEKKSVVELLKTFMKSRKNERISVEQYNKDIDAAMEQIARGEYTTFEDLEKEMQTW
ncbi:MAG TPA: hypothetical protein VFE32_15420 [Puia sp.]|jgi:hypothetical protein|nr:hypothetical protein [Puia sp.]